jgi:hypothetical protein
MAVIVAPMTIIMAVVVINNVADVHAYGLCGDGHRIYFLSSVET